MEVSNSGNGVHDGSEDEEYGNDGTDMLGMEPYFEPSGTTDNSTTLHPAPTKVQDVSSSTLVLHPAPIKVQDVLSSTLVIALLTRNPIDHVDSHLEAGTLGVTIVLLAKLAWEQSFVKSQTE